MRVAVAMSGGVDSSVAALILKEQGHDVFGISMQLHDGPADGDAGGAARRCCGVRDLLDARRVAGELGIPFYAANMRQLFEREVMEPFAAAYAAGTTPIPCVACNGTMKFRVLLRRVRAMGADVLATGHYAEVAAEGGRFKLRRAADRSRDQSYFLYQLGQAELPYVLFPLARLPKIEVRAMARRAGLPVGDKPDSQEICFVPDGDHARFVAARRTIPGGEIRDTGGALLGAHDGIHRFTVGQRRGLGLSAAAPRYVVAIDAPSHTVVVGGRADLEAAGLRAAAVSWVDRPPAGPVRAEVRVRSRHHEAPATVAPGPDGTVEAAFDAPQVGVAPGQAAVFYRGDEVLGGGTIAAALTRPDGTAGSPSDRRSAAPSPRTPVPTP